MRTKRGSGPFGTQLYFSKEEIDDMCESALVEAKFLPAQPAPVRIDRFIETHFNNCHIDYGTDMGADVMGFTLFSPKGAPLVVGVSPSLCDGTQVNDRRVRTTLAHEAGHCLMHPVLFMPDTDTAGLLGSNLDFQNRRILCRTSDFERGYDGRWWEVQANAAIGGFLLPKSIFRRAAEKFMVPVGSLGLKEIPATKREAASRELADVFDVNPKVVSIRLERLFPLANQTEL